jgi:hypothetical protein
MKNFKEFYFAKSRMSSLGKNAKSLVEANNFYLTIHCWWLSIGAILEASVHELVNWLNFWHFHVRQWGGFHGPCEHVTYKVPLIPSLFYLFKIEIPFALKFHLQSTFICASIYVVTF